MRRASCSGLQSHMHHDELVAREARAQVVLPDRRPQHGADRAQRPVARLVAVGVVDLLEPIEVEHDDADAALGPGGARQARLELADRASAGSASPVSGSVCDSCCVCSKRVELKMTAAACSLTRPRTRRCSSVKQPGDGVIDHQPADEPALEPQRAREQRGQLFAVRPAAVGAGRQAQRDLAPRSRRPLEQRFGAGPVGVAAHVPVVRRRRGTARRSTNGTSRLTLS